MTDSEADDIRILIVDDNQTTVENVTRLLNFEQGLRVIGSAANGRQGVEMARDMNPDVILMDINMPDMDGIEACRQISQNAPRSRVMMMSVQSDMAYLKQAMNAGAREFLTKPFDFDELIATIRRVYASELSPAGRVAIAEAQREELRGPELPSPAAVDGVLLAVYAPKGGVGCSTVAVNLAVALAGSREADVVLVDGDLYFGDQDALLDLQPVLTMADLVGMFDPDDRDLLNQMLSEHNPSGIRLLPAPPRPELAELVRPEWFRSLLDVLVKRHDYIVVDLGSRSDEFAHQTLDRADRIILTLVPEVPAIKDAHLFLSMEGPQDYPPEKVLVVLNRYHRNWGFDPDTVSRAIGRSVALLMPTDDKAAIAAVNRGNPVLLAAPQSDISRRVLELEKLIPSKEALAEEQREHLGREQDVPSTPIRLQQPAADKPAGEAKQERPPETPATVPWWKRLLERLDLPRRFAFLKRRSN